MSEPVIVQQQGQNGETHYYTFPEGLPAALASQSRETIGYLKTCDSIPVVKFEQDPGDLNNTLRWPDEDNFATGRITIDRSGVAGPAYDMGAAGRLNLKVDSLPFGNGTISPLEVEAEHGQILERQKSNQKPEPEPCLIGQEQTFDYGTPKSG